MAARIYVVENEETASLVRAVSATKALKHVIQTNYQVHVATVDEVAEYMGQGATVEDATGEVDTEADGEGDTAPD